MTTPITVPARSRAQLVAHGIEMNRGGIAVLSGVNLTVLPGSRVGIVGENGQGKTTLIQILAGSLAPDSGSVRRIGTLGTADQEMPINDGRTVGDLIDAELADARAAIVALDEAAAALALGGHGTDRAYSRALADAELLDAWDADRRVDVALNALHAETNRSRPLAEMSVGQRYRVRLACLLGANHDFLLLDEPTNHLDRSGLDFLTTKLNESAGCVILVSHDRALLSDVATVILDLDPTRDGKPRLYGGGYAGYLSGRRTERARWEVEYERQQIEFALLTEELETAQGRLETSWRPDKGTGKHQRATRAPALVRQVNRRIEALENREITTPEPPLKFAMPWLPDFASEPAVLARIADRPRTPEAHSDAPRDEEILVSAIDVTVDGRLPVPVTGTIEAGSRLVVSGPNGAGKSTLLAVLAGLVEPTSGSVRVEKSVRIELLAQESAVLAASTPGRAYDDRLSELLSRGLIDEDHFVSFESLGLLNAFDTVKRISDLSIGQQRRLDLALALAAQPHLLLLDEPTNHLSISLVEDLTEALGTTPAAVVVATHDRQMRRDLSQWPHLELAASTNSVRLTGERAKDNNHEKQRL